MSDNQQLYHYYFNPHFRKGSDPRKIFNGMSSDISIHTSAREVTNFTDAYCIPERISIHTSAREVTKAAGVAGAAEIISIHTSAREVTRTMYRIGLWRAISIHTSAREVTATSWACGRWQKISIHTSAREVTANLIKKSLLFYQILYIFYIFIHIYSTTNSIIFHFSQILIQKEVRTSQGFHVRLRFAPLIILSY